VYQRNRNSIRLFHSFFFYLCTAGKYRRPCRGTRRVRQGDMAEEDGAMIIALKGPGLLAQGTLLFKIDTRRGQPKDQALINPVGEGFT
jgi:hypothetical protein